MQKTKITRINYAIETYRKNCSSYAFELSKSRLADDANYRECLLGRDSIYIPIDKCASNSMRKVLTENGFISMQEIRDWDKALEKFKDWNHFAVVRQPVNRYISGLTEFIFRNSHKNPYEYVEKSLSQNKFIFDGHTMPMDCTLYFRDNIKLFKLSPSMHSQISSYLRLKSFPIENLNKGVSKFKESAQKLFDRYCMNNPEFYEFCKKDFDIWKSAC